MYTFGYVETGWVRMQPVAGQNCRYDAGSTLYRHAYGKTMRPL